MIDRGLPRPSTRIFVGDDVWAAITGDDSWGAVIGMGWVDAKVGVEWAEHRRDLVQDVRFRNLLHRTGWLLMEAMPHCDLGRTIRQCAKALRLRRGRG